MKSNVEYRLYVNNSIKFLFRNLSNISDEVFLAVHYFAKNAWPGPNYLSIIYAFTIQDDYSIVYTAFQCI